MDSPRFFWTLFISIIIYKNPKKLRKKFKIQKIFFSSQPHLSIKTKSTGSNHVDQGKKWVSGCFGSKPSFLTKTVISDQNRVHPVNTSQIMLTRVKNEFRAVLDQNRHFSTKTRFTGSIPIKCFFWYFIFCLRLKRAFSNTDLNF